MGENYICSPWITAIKNHADKIISHILFTISFSYRGTVAGFLPGSSRIVIKQELISREQSRAVSVWMENVRLAFVHGAYSHVFFVVRIRSRSVFTHGFCRAYLTNPLWLICSGCSIWCHWRRKKQLGSNATSCLKVTFLSYIVLAKFLITIIESEHHQIYLHPFVLILIVTSGVHLVTFCGIRKSTCFKSLPNLARR